MGFSGGWDLDLELPRNATTPVQPRLPHGSTQAPPSLPPKFPRRNRKDQNSQSSAGSWVWGNNPPPLPAIHVALATPIFLVVLHMLFCSVTFHLNDITRIVRM